MQAFFIVLVLIFLGSFGGFAWRGCAKTVESKQEEIMTKQKEYELKSKRWREDVENDIKALSARREWGIQQPYESVRRQLELNDQAFHREVKHLEQAIALRLNDRDFHRVVRGKMAREYKTYQDIGQDIVRMRMRLDTAAMASRLYHQPLTAEWQTFSSKIDQANSSLNKIGRDIQEAAALLQIEEAQYDPTM